MKKVNALTDSENLQIGQVIGEGESGVGVRGSEYWGGGRKADWRKVMIFRDLQKEK